MYDLRAFLQTLEEHRLLTHIKRRVSTEYEISGLLKKTDGKLPLLFEQVESYPTPFVAGLGGTRDTLALDLGIAPQDINAALAYAIANPIPATRVAQGAVQQHVITPPFNVDDYYPLLKYGAKDTARFLVSGVMVAKDLSGTRTYTSIRRMQYLGGNRFCLLVTSNDMKQQIQACKEQRRPMELAVMFGVSPAVVLASQISTQLYHADKLAVTGALYSTSMPVVKCRTVDVDVLADAEMVLEGRLLAWEEETEGPFGELAGYYGKISRQPVFEVTAMTWRDGCIAQTILAGSAEEKLPEALAREVALLSTIRQTVPWVNAVHIPLAAVGRFHAVIQLQKRGPGDAKQALLAAFSSDKDLKHCVAVDTDVDIFSPEDVEWAIATRFQADTDLFVISGAMGSPLEPSHGLRGVTAKMGLDATAPIGDANYERTYIPGEEHLNLADYL